MRAAPLPLLATGTSRLSTSCPSLCKDGVPEQECPSPTHLEFYPQSRKGSSESRQWGTWDRRDEGRRSSWAALEPGARHDVRQRSALNGHSASLSSMESEGEVSRPVRHSTHSLNDNDLAATGTSRLSTSCPSLCKDGVPEQECPSPTHLEFYPQSRKGSSESRQWGTWDRRDEGRRSSWAALEPGARHDVRQRSALNGHSASLSSMESEGEVSRPVRHSTHSLNDNDLAKEFEKVTAALRAAADTSSSRLLPRLPLQKSVSTPSIVAAVHPTQPPPAANILSAGGASETESDDDTSAPVANQPRRNNTQEHLGLHRLAFLEQCYNRAAFDHHAEKRRKRGSLFFRKKKDKSRKASHVWSAAAAGGACDWCARDLADKPALYCDNCTMTVHQNVCKDYIVECNKPKSSKTSVGKSLSASSGKSSKRSSVSGQSQNSNSNPNPLLQVKGIGVCVLLLFSKKQSSGCYSPWRRVATKLGVQ
ncbi:putative RHO guanyl-nucleotide exchange factor [Danaus plexippus plexippus]|uniref:RHO guanyl-nucleotide exchange factor n=1 Tax=Danaus plexippus plexippus TaxID=278856 RepID=A0A212FM06_DANPL|nr:putative RHO guanyl-nucleotide exchange factor [Danaus plexippus plexippus]